MKKIHIILLFLTVGVAFQSCEKYFDPPLVFEKDPGSGLTKTRKVMLISIDGLSGIELEKYQPEHIKALLPKSKYSFEGFSDANTTDASSWTSMLSGKNSGKHGVVYEDFENETEEDPDDPHGNNSSGSSTGYISVYQRLLESGKRLKSLSLTSWQPLADNLFALSDEFEALESDEEVKDKTIEKLENKEDDLSFIVVNFRELIEAGKSGGFTMDNDGYKKKLDQIDGYVGTIIDAIQERKTYEDEDWLIVITSNHGGIDKTYGGGSMEERTIPVIYYHDSFVGQQFVAPPSIIGFNAESSSFIRVPADQAERYNINTSDEYTIQLKMLQHTTGTNNAAILSKQGNTGNSDNGWSFIHNGPSNGWRLKVKGAHSVSSIKDFELEQWYTLTAIIYRDGNDRKAIVLTDDAIGQDVVVNGEGISDSDLKIGYGASWTDGNATHTIKDLKIYNKALPVEFIQETYCQSLGLEEDPYAQNLIGYWPIGDGMGKTVKNYVENAPNAGVTGAENWGFRTNNFCKLPIDEKEKESQIYLYDVDLLPQIFYWLEVETNDSWGLEGEVFLDGYEKEFITH